MSLLQRACKTLGRLSLVVGLLPLHVFGQTTNSTNFYAPQGQEYAPAGNLPGDQINPAMALSTTGGFLVWEDNITDGDGLGVSAVLLDNTFSPIMGNFRVNQQGAYDQENPQVALLHGGGAAFVWQGGQYGFQHIFARFLSSSNLWVTGDVEVNTATNYQVNPAIAVLTNGNVVVAWGSYGQDNADGYQGVYAQILSPTGQKIGGEFRVNQFTPFNQRTPAVAAFGNGGFIVAWVSEQERLSQSVGGTGIAGTGYNSADIYARLYNQAGSNITSEFLVNTTTNICANPTIAVASDNTYIIAWSQKNAQDQTSSWDIYARQFATNGVGGSAQVVNTQLYGDQYDPKISSVGTDYMVVWTSLGQDGSKEGVYSQFLHGDGSHAGGEQLVNTTVLNGQKFQTVASDGVGRFLVAWSSYVGGGYGLDINAQRFATTLQPLLAPAPPYVLALDSYSLSASWSPVVGLSVSNYELFLDGSGTPYVVTNDIWASQNFNPSSTHTFQLAYVLTDGQVSPLSTPVVSGTTWGRDNNYDGLPDDWETLYFGSNESNWPKQGALTLLAPGVTVLDVFLWGANPNNPSTWLKQWINQTPEGLFLNWNTVPGGVYQVLSSTNLTTWTPLGTTRFASGTSDSIFLGMATKSYYQIVRNRF